MEVVLGIFSGLCTGPTGEALTDSSAQMLHAQEYCCCTAAVFT